MRILFEHEYLYYLPHFEPIIKEIKNRGEKGIFGSIRAQTTKVEKRLFAKEMKRLGLEIISGDFETQRRKVLYDMNFDLIFIGNKSSLAAIKSSNSFAVMVYHGIGLKNSYYSDLTKDMDLICVESEQRKIILAENHLPVTVTGFTKLDLLETDWHHKKGDNKKTTILYAPTFFPSSLQKTIPFLHDLSSYKIIIKLHHFYWTKPRYIRIRKNLEYSIKNKKNIYLVSFEKYNLIDQFLKSDILISDYSSAIFEFLPFNRPIIQTVYYSLRWRYKLFPYLLDKRLDLDRIEALDFIEVCQDEKRLQNILNTTLNNPNRLSKQRLNACSTYLGQVDGQASKRVVDAITSSGIPIGQVA